MEWAEWLTATQWTALGAVFAGAGVVVAVVIAWSVNRASSQSARDTQRVARSVEELTRRSRRDELLRQLAESADADHLKLLIEEGRRIARDPAERLALEKKYFTNPSGPLLNYEHQVPDGLTKRSHQELMRAVLNTLPARYANEDMRWRTKDLAHLTHLARTVGVSTSPIATLVLEGAAAGRHLGDATIREILSSPLGYSCPSNIEAASDYLHGLLYREVPRASAINVIAGVSLAIWDFEHPVRYRSAALTDGGAPLMFGPSTMPGAHSALVGFVMLMQRRGSLWKGPDEDGLTICVDHGLAVMVHALGIVAGGNQHVAMRAMESLVPILQDFPPSRFASTGVFADHLQDGVALLLKKYPGTDLTTGLYKAAVRLVPGVDVELPA